MTDTTSCRTAHSAVSEILIKDISASWNELGCELHVPFNDRESLRKNISLSDDSRLENVLTNWIGNETKDVKWRVILEAVKALKRKDLIKKMINHLKHTQSIFPWMTFLLANSEVRNIILI